LEELKRADGGNCMDKLTEKMKACREELLKKLTPVKAEEAPELTTNKKCPNDHNLKLTFTTPQKYIDSGASKDSIKCTAC